MYACSWPADPADGRSAIVIVVGGEPSRFQERIKDAWIDWRMWFSKDVRRNAVLVLLLDANFYKDVEMIRDTLDLRKLNCKRNPHACEVGRNAFLGHKLGMCASWLHAIRALSAHARLEGRQQAFNIP